MDRLINKPVIAVMALVLLCGYLFFFQLGALPLTDPDESFYAETAKEMLAKDEWVTPYLYGKPQFEKPILFYWLVEASFKVFGVNEFAARLPSAIFGTIGVVAIFFLGSLLFTRRAGFLSALVLAANVEYIALARACVTDMALFVFMLLGILFFMQGYIQGKRRCYLLSAAALALAVLTKGPIYLGLFGLTCAVFLFLAKDMRAFKQMPLWQSVMVFMAVAIPWYLAIYNVHGKAFIDGFFGVHNVNRFLVSEHKIGSQAYYNIPIIFAGLFPWSAFLPVGLWHIFRKKEGEKKAPIFVIVYLVIIFGFFSISSTKLPTYIFPCFASLALIVGVLLDDFLRGDRRISKGTRVSYYFLIFVMLLGWVGCAIYAGIDFPSIIAGTVISGLIFAMGGALSLIVFKKNKLTPALVLIVFSVAIFLYPLSVLIVPEIGRYEASKEVSEVLSIMMKPGEGLGAESNYLPGLAFYTGLFPADLDNHHNQILFMNSAKRVWAVMKEKNHAHLYDSKITKAYVKPSYVTFKTGKRAIITNEMPADGRYLVKRERPL